MWLCVCLVCGCVCLQVIVCRRTKKRMCKREMREGLSQIKNGLEWWTRVSVYLLVFFISPPSVAHALYSLHSHTHSCTCTHTHTRTFSAPPPHCTLFWHSRTWDKNFLQPFMVYLSFINMYALSGTKTSVGFVSDLKQQKMILPPRNFLGQKNSKFI